MTKLVAPATVIQAALPDMFNNIPEQFYTDTMELFERNASLCYSKLKAVPGLKPVMPEGAMYMMVRIPPIAHIFLREVLSLTSAALVGICSY